MGEKHWTVPKVTGSYADALMAIGLAHLVNSVKGMSRSRGTIIRDHGDRYEVASDLPIAEDQVLALRPDPGYPYIKFKATDDAPVGVPVFDYEEARALEKRYREFTASTKAAKRRRGKARDIKALTEDSRTAVPPPPDLQVMKSFNVLRMGSDAYNNLHRAISGSSDFGDIVAKYLGFCPDRRLNETAFSKAVSSLQFFNPIAGKGVNRSKPNGTALGGLPNRLVDWFSEWMKFRALHVGLVSWQVGDDTKVMVLAPAEIEVGLLEEIRLSLLKAGLSGSLTLEVRGVLTVARELINRSEELRSGGRFRFAGSSPRQIVAGFHVAHFQSLGNASAVMNLSFIGLPGWFAIRDRESAENWLTVLEEHERAVKSLDESHSDEVKTLILYRDFLSSGRLNDALAFFTEYDIGMMRKMAAGKYTTCLTTANLRRLLMSYPSVKDIIENPGFEAVAAAVRRATIKAQIRKAKTGKVVFEVQYGLAQDWKRKARHRDEFIKEISDFVQRYNSETAKHAEQGKEMRPYLYTEHVDQLIDLIKDDQNSELVGMLLLAYGYALETKEVDDSEDQ